jgi:flagellar motility protein MotE (MotC chaperone)
MKLPRYLRLLPSVVVVGASLLVLKTTDLVHAAYAQAGEQSNQQTGDKVAAIADGPAPANKDYAGSDDDQIASASQVDVTNSLSKRRRELDAREGQLTTQANMIAAAEQRVDAKITQLKQLQTQINALLGQRDDAQKAQVAALVKTYSTMKPKDAARIFNTLPDEVVVPVAQAMKSDVLASVLANMEADRAKTLTVKLANKLALPEVTDAAAPAAVPGPTAAATTPTKASAAPEKAAAPKT